MPDNAAGAKGRILLCSVLSESLLSAAGSRQEKQVNKQNNYQLAPVDLTCNVLTDIKQLMK